MQQSIKLEKPKSPENIMVLRPTEIHNSVGCDHFFEPSGSGKSVCIRCNLGLNGIVTGKLPKR